jgi:hypothetical protein
VGQLVSKWVPYVAAVRCVPRGLMRHAVVACRSYAVGGSMVVHRDDEEWHTRAVLYSATVT